MRLPVVQARPARAERPSLATVAPTDLGLGAVARDVAAWEGEVEKTRLMEEEAQRVEDEKAVQPILNSLTEAYEPTFSEAGAQWDGLTPGFARGMMAALDAAADPLLRREDLPPGQRDALARGISQYKQATGQRAIQYQAQRRGEIAAQQAAARRTADIGAIMGDYMGRMAEAQREIDNNYDGSSGDYVEQMQAAHAAAVAGAMEGRPEALAPFAAQKFEEKRLALLGRSLDVAAQSEQGYLAAQVRTTADQLINAVQTAPGMLDEALTQATDAVAALPVGARGAALAGLQDGLIEGAMTALIRDGQQDVALRRLNSGEFDAVLKPATKARLLDGAMRKSEALTFNDHLLRQDMQAAIADDLASRSADGVGRDGVDPASVEAVLGPGAAAKYLLDRDRADGVHASLAGLSQMTEGQMRARLAELAPTPGEPGYAEAAQARDLTARAVERELTARREDPAGWALREASRLGDWRQRMGEGSLQQRRAAATRYAANTMQLQADVGVPPAQRRILSKADAERVVAQFQQAPERGQGLRDLGAFVSLFGIHSDTAPGDVDAQNARHWRVLKELGEGGLRAEDLAAAVDLAGSTPKLGRYVSAINSGHLATLKPTEKGRLEAAVEGAMAPYLNSFRIGPRSGPLMEGRRAAAVHIAAEEMRQGASMRDAARTAAELFAGDYAFVGPQGFRVPRAEAERDTGFRIGGSSAGDLIRGAAAEARRLTDRDGEALTTPPDVEGRGLSDAGRRRRYADGVRLNGRWVTTPDDRGVLLAVPGENGQLRPVLGRGGGVIFRTWSELRSGGSPTQPARRQTGQATGGARSQVRGVRNNNPTNIRPSGDQWRGMVGIDRAGGGPGFVIFDTPLLGARAAARDLTTKYRSGLDTVQSIIARHAPRSENDVTAYVRSVSAALGVQPRQRLNLDDPDLMARMLKAMADHENGPGHWTLGQMRQGVAAR